MLKRLLAIKKRREDGILHDLRENQLKIDTTFVKEKELGMARRANKREWKASNQHARTAIRYKTTSTLKEYGIFYEEDQKMMGQLKALFSTRSSLYRDREALQAKLRNNRIEQEKILYLIEHTDA